ncbi:MAG: transglutaminase-like domain-containing protein [Lentisphaerota bacterium]
MRTIDTRYMPAVGGIDLEQSLNYIALADVSLDFIYDKYTSGRLIYAAGSRPVLEAIAAGLVGGIADELEKIDKLTTFVAEKVPWAGYYHLAMGHKLACNRNLNEEDLIASGFGWCNEQARLLCALTQVVGIPSRLVFAAARKGGGHVVVEALTSNGWLLIDQSFCYLFINNGKIVDAYNVWHNKQNRNYFESGYKNLCAKLTKDLGEAILKDEFSMSQMSNPLDGFEILGYHNYFIL